MRNSIFCGKLRLVPIVLAAGSLFPACTATVSSSDDGGGANVNAGADPTDTDNAGGPVGGAGSIDQSNANTGINGNANINANAGTDAVPVTVTHTLALAEAADGATIRALLGSNGGPYGSASDTTRSDMSNQMDQIGVTLIRTHDFDGPLDMSTMYPDTAADPSLESSYDFTVSDEYFAKIVDGGFDVYLRIGDSAGSAAGFPAGSPQAPDNQANWISAAVHVVGHYTDSGRWGRNPVRYVEVWNEPDSSHFWDGTPTEFYELFAGATIALKAAYPDLMIGGPGATHASYAVPMGQSWFLGLLSYCQTHGAPLDFLSWHTYTNDPETLAEGAAWFRQQLDAYGYTTTESHITEWNTDAHASGLTPTDIDDLRNGARGAALNTAGWILLQGNDIAVSTFYRSRDPQFDRSEFYGLLDRSGRLKPVALAFGLWSQIATGYSGRMETTISTTSSATLYALAGKSADGKIALLLANPGSAALGITVSGFTGNVTISQISDAADSLEQVSGSVAGFELPGYSVQLVNLP